MVEVNRFDVFLIVLDPTEGAEINKTRPCLIISPNDMNDYIRTVIVAPMTTKIKLYPTRIPINFENKNGQVALDQIRTVDKTRLIKKLGTINLEESIQVINVLQEMFAHKILR